MRLISRYLLSQLVAPFVFALTALTSLMLLQQVARRFGALVGKGLPWSVIGEVFALSVPFIVAMTLPMAVLLAVLFAFSHLAADNEITAMRASGISVGQILRPVLIAGVLMAAVNFVFTDQVLPRSNARLRGLLFDIQRKKPTFELREQVINEMPSRDLFLRASRIDAATGRMRGVTIYDMEGQDVRRIIYADSGQMGMAPNQTDLNLRLYDGFIHEHKSSEPVVFQRTGFVENNIRVEGVSDSLVRGLTETVRGDREMSTCEMLDVVRTAGRDRDQAARDRRERLLKDLRALLDLPPPGQLPPVAEEKVGGYCRWFGELWTRLSPRTVEAKSPAHQDTTRRAAPTPAAPPRAAPVQAPPRQAPPRQAPPQQAAPRQAAPPQTASPQQDKLQELNRRRAARTGAAPAPAPPATPLRSTARPTPSRPAVQLTSWAEISSAQARTQEASRRANSYAVEVHKKWAISAACVIFVLAGIPMALRFPRGGMGLVIGGGLAVFSIYYVGLIAGEGLADRGIVQPAVAMWSSNAVLLLLALVGLWRVSRESGSTRGGDLADLFYTLFGRFRRRRA